MFIKYFILQKKVFAFNVKRIYCSSSLISFLSFIKRFFFLSVTFTSLYCVTKVNVNILVTFFFCQVSKLFVKMFCNTSISSVIFVNEAAEENSYVTCQQNFKVEFSKCFPKAGFLFAVMKIKAKKNTHTHKIRGN